jgi:hypothetical protein
MGQEAGEKGAGAVDLQPTIPKSDRLPGVVRLFCWHHRFTRVAERTLKPDT